MDTYAIVEQLIILLTGCGWPITIFAIILFLGLRFPKPIAERIRAIQKISPKGLELTPYERKVIEEESRELADTEFKKIGGVIVELEGKSEGRAYTSGKLSVEEAKNEESPPEDEELDVSIEEDVKVDDSVVVKMKPFELKAELAPLSVKTGIDWTKVGTLYWLANDLMWVKSMISQGADPDRVLNGVYKALRYSEDLGFGKRSFPIQQLELSIVILDALVGLSYRKESEKIVLHYRTVSKYIDSIKFFITRLAEEIQPGFEKLY